MLYNPIVRVLLKSFFFVSDLAKFTFEHNNDNIII